MAFSVGDEIRVTESCFGTIVGKVYEVKINVSSSPYIKEEMSCFHADKWELVTSTQKNMAKFEVGSKVKVISQSRGWGQVKKGDIGLVVRVMGGGEYKVDFPNQPNWTAATENLELLVDNKSKTMETLKKLTSAMKRALNPELQAQYRAGLINGSGLELTGEGKEALMDILSNKYKTELTERANEIIKEAEEKNK